MAQWALYPTQRVFRVTINPGEAKALPIFATAVTSRARYTPNEPLAVRAIVHFESGDDRYQEIFQGLVSGVN